MQFAPCGRCFVPFWLWLCGLALALMAVSPAFAEDTCLRLEGLPELTVQLRIQQGKFAVDRASSKSRLDLKELGVKFKDWSPAQLQTELFDYVDRSLAARGTVLRQLVLSTDAESVVPSPERIAKIDAGIAQRASVDAATRSLMARTSPWDAALNELPQWSTELNQLGLPWAQGEGSVGEVWRRLALQAFGDGPLLSMDLREPSKQEIKENPTVLQARQRRQLMGVLSFVVSPPFDADDGRKLRPSENPVQWERLRSGFADDVLAPFDGQLWRRADMLRRAEDYMALRGVELRARRRFDEQDVLCNVATAQDEPQGYPGIVLMRPGALQDTGAGRIILSSDPLPAAVYVVAGADQLKLALRALYLLLPSSDFTRVRADPLRYLENVHEMWLIGPNNNLLDAWRLRFDQGPGRDLQFSEALMTRRMLAERLQRLALLNYQARIDQVTIINPPQSVIDGVRQHRRRQGALVLGPIVAAAPANAKAGAADKKEPPLDVTELGDVAAPQALAEAPRAPSVLRHHLKLGVEHRGGKPLRAFGSFRRDGLSNDDTLAVEFGHSGQVLGSTAYERDFVGFDQLGRRLQLSARVYSDFTPDRMVGDVRTDVRRNGAQVNGTLDLWRDWNDSFAQAEFALSRERTETTAAGSAAAGTGGAAAGTGAGAAASAGPAVEWLRRADFTLTVARSRFGTAASAHDAAVISTSLAQASGGSYRSVSLALNHHQFIGFFDRVDFRFFARGVSRRAPAAEMPTFGGEDSVRGLREDFATGRALWALQSEWWMPVPWKTDSEGLASLLRRQLALAAWVDTGAIYKPTTAIARRHTAAGLGLRYSQSDALTMRLDLARPIAGVDPDQRRLRLLFTVAVRPRL